MTVPTLKQTAKPVKPKINWARNEEADNFAKTVKLFRQGKYDEDSFRRFRLQHGAYGTRMTNDYAMVRIKLPAGEIYPDQFEKISQLSEQYSIGNAHFTTRESIQLHWVVLEDVSEILRSLAEVGMTSREACGNSVRNVMCSPMAGVCPDEEFDSMGCNVLAIAPKKCVMLKGNPITEQGLKDHGCEVLTYHGEHISVMGGGGPTCLTRPMKRTENK